MSDLITRADIAQLCGIQPRNVREAVETRPDFPRPVLALTERLVRWERKAVLAWLESQRKKASR